MVGKIADCLLIRFEEPRAEGWGPEVRLQTFALKHSEEGASLFIVLLSKWWNMSDTSEDSDLIAYSKRIHNNYKGVDRGDHYRRSLL